METALGTVKVMVQGDRSKPAIFTYHDIGLNSECIYTYIIVQTGNTLSQGTHSSLQLSVVRAKIDFALQTLNFT